MMSQGDISKDNVIVAGADAEWEPCLNEDLDYIWCVTFQEYGITKEEKMMIGMCICTPLLRKILVDLQHNVDEDSTRLDTRYSKGVSTPHRHVRTRMYFTSESHIHSLLTMLRYGGLLDVSVSQFSQRPVIFKLYVEEGGGVKQINNHCHNWIMLIPLLLPQLF